MDEDVACACSGALLSHEKTGMMPSAATRTGLARTIPSLSPSEGTEGVVLYDIPYMWDLKRSATNELTKQKYLYG